ncbi:MAG: hypothetical protein SGI83_03625 [Bacteroidota bacterium]|nr:hypothetical protein [Bacteroidota bacterium]
MTQLILVLDYECVDVCKDAWTNYIQYSLRNLVTTAKGNPKATGRLQTENKKKLVSGN